MRESDDFRHFMTHLIHSTYNKSNSPQTEARWRAQTIIFLIGTGSSAPRTLFGDGHDPGTRNGRHASSRFTKFCDVSGNPGINPGLY
jgi:hypothetical protein